MLRRSDDPGASCFKDDGIVNTEKDYGMKPPPKDEQFSAFTDAMRKIMTVSKADIQDKPKPKLKPSAKAWVSLDPVGEANSHS